MKRVLIVDDEVWMAEGLRDLFAMQNIKAEIAADRASAEEMLRGDDFAVMLADVRLRTEEEGLLLLEAVRRLSPATRVASMSGAVTPILETALRARGARHVIRKPAEFDEILGVIRELLGEDDGTPAEEIDADALYADLRKVLFSVPMRRFRLDAADAEDIVQQAWCLFLEKRAGIVSPRAWLSCVVANLCKQRLTDMQRVVASDGAEFEELLDERSGVNDDVLAVRDALARADERTRQMCILIGMENHSYEEVSARLSIPVGSVGPLYIRAKAKLRQLL